VSGLGQWNSTCRPVGACMSCCAREESREGGLAKARLARERCLGVVTVWAVSQGALGGLGRAVLSQAVRQYARRPRAERFLDVAGLAGEGDGGEDTAVEMDGAWGRKAPVCFVCAEAMARVDRHAVADYQHDVAT